MEAKCTIMPSSSLSAQLWRPSAITMTMKAPSLANTNHVYGESRPECGRQILAICRLRCYAVGMADPTDLSRQT